MRHNGQAIRPESIGRLSATGAGAAYWLQSALTLLFLSVARSLDRLAARRIERRLTLAGVEVALAVLSLGAAVAVVYGGAGRVPGLRLAAAGAVLVAAKLLAGSLTGAFSVRWRYVDIHDAGVILRAAFLAGGSSFLVLASFQLLPDTARLVLVDACAYLLLASGVRVVARRLHEWGRRVRASAGSTVRRAVIVGAGEAASLLIKSILASPKMSMELLAAVDDDPNKRGKQLHGVTIVGPVAELPVVVEHVQADEIIIAIPSATTEQMGHIVDACVSTKLPFRIAPDPEDILSVRSPASTLRDVQPSDLLGRPQADLNVGDLRAELEGARILITGAAGSIGSELVRQLVKVEPAALYLLDRNENDLFFLCEELQRHHVQVPYAEIIQDVRDERRLAGLLQDVRPTHVFHAAAFKHVPMMEFHLVQAVDNNILGTWSVLQAARAVRVRKFVLISSDKAVRPSNVMGATKRFAEVLVAEGTNGTPSHGVIVRFGNVLGSNGSVVPLFQRQIAAGGPVTVTSGEATRYFMTTSEAAQLVLQAASMPECVDQVALLDMGTPVRIWDLAERMIRLSGLRPGADIEIIEIGLRPGEKLHEELWWEAEHTAPSSHPKIMLARVGALTNPTSGLVPIMRQLVESEDESALHQLLERSVGLTNGTRPYGRRLPRSRAQVAGSPLQASV